MGPRIQLGVDAGAVKHGVTQPSVTGAAHAHQQSLAALRGHRRHPRHGAQYAIIAMCERFGALAEHRGGEDSTHSWHGTENLDVTVLPVIFIEGQLLDQMVDGAYQVRQLAMEQFQARQQQQYLFGDGWGGTGGQRQRRLPQQLAEDQPPIVSMLTAPLFHLAGVGPVMTGLLVGGSVVLLKGSETIVARPVTSSHSP